MTKVQEKILREGIQRTFEAAVLAKSAEFVHDQVMDALRICKMNGITNYDDWIRYCSLKEDDVNAKPKRTGAGADVAEKQDGGKRHAGRGKRRGDV